MAKANKLTALRVSRIVDPGMYGDGAGLWLRVEPSGSKGWLFRFMLNGKARTMGLGGIGAVSLARARQKAAECRRLRAEGIDPIEARKRAGEADNLAQAKGVAFKSAAEAYIAAHKAGWRSVKHGEQWISTLTTYAYPVFGDLPVAAVDVGMVMKVLEPIWTAKPETASRLRGRIEAVLDWATARGYRTGENAARWKGHLAQLLPPRSRVRSIAHHPALPYAEAGAFMATLRDQEGVAALALQFTIYTAARTGEVTGARWAEIDFAEKMWTVPAHRIKAGREHRVPLSSPALD
ncbi:MAG: DUF4102 domain-containing protein, partial [Alphaproteobacteria bacterium]|nr:DUF4102 domain-containing protein [Alphaproteobacteria bacterium]